ncbi:ESCRT-1 complex, Vps28 subunit [Saitoella complicata NRRL Y-17804]|uniref:ESCRT-1 complex, Vps28 subunit n=1 Tax=Saitoella complicata (strain BCRC 22490 / CBS 7301 / JCM 7358 / NBRC 10748 / NRRL Y-17804) TaxID=698492 RepID=UPI000868161B|nr:ESCRT-1 complex, Vps28 subunit [Saitoella complicata NRRL Y-17804]ODQ55785.1 ESCRT-1 complex, Vps28 subunit [Saitoella complicata NRRL Y-17804]
MSYYTGITEPARPASAPLPLTDPVKLWTTPTDRDLHHDLAELYSLLLSLEFLEKAYVRDQVSEEEYERNCVRLLGQWGTLLKSEAVKGAFGDLEGFMGKYRISAPAAAYRISTGVPASFEHAPAPPVPEVSTSTPQTFAVQNFITFLDALKLSYRAKDQLHPLLSDLIQSVDAGGARPFEGRGKILYWLIELNKMKASDECSEEQVRQMMFDIEGVYGEFFRRLSG